MFTDAFGEEYFLRDERHFAGVRCLRGLELWKFFLLWKSNKKVLQCQCNSGDFHATCATR
jgi:hypothetical protein